MKTVLIILSIALNYFAGVLSGEAQNAIAQTALVNCQTQVVTLAVQSSTGSPVSYDLNSNQVVSVSGYAFNGTPTIAFTFNNGITTTNNVVLNQLFFTGLTNVTLYPPKNAGFSYTDFVTLTILTPSTNNVSVTPVNSVVIPSDAKGNVQIILESSSDLVNWIPSQAGTYGSNYTNRFFRVRAVMIP